MGAAKGAKQRAIGFCPGLGYGVYNHCSKATAIQVIIIYTLRAFLVGCTYNISVLIFISLKIVNSVTR